MLRLIFTKDNFIQNVIAKNKNKYNYENSLYIVKLIHKIKKLEKIEYKFNKIKIN